MAGTLIPDLFPGQTKPRALLTQKYIIYFGNATAKGILTLRTTIFSDLWIYGLIDLLLAPVSQQELMAKLAGPIW